MIVGVYSELWRLRVNFCVLVGLIFFCLLAFDGTLPSLYQYVTNPREEDMNKTSSVRIIIIMRL